MENNTINNEKGRYRGLIISIALFLTLIAALLAFTFYTSQLLEQDTLLIDTSNEVANSGQAVVKDLFDLNASYGEDISSPHMRTVLSRLEKNSDLIGERLRVIETGGIVETADGEQYTLPAVTDPSTLADVNAAKEQWAQLEPKIDAYLKDARNIRVDSSDDLALAVEQAKTSSLRMNESLEALTVDVFRNAQAQADRIRLIQVLGVIAILAYFLIFVFFFVRRLRESDAQTVAARREIQEIMQTVNTGLFLLDKDLNIGQQHSQALAGIIGADRIAGENFTNVLRGRISDKDLGTTKQFIEQLYNPRVKEKLVNDLNPLQKVMLHNDNTEQGSNSRYLDFNFSRVYENDEIARILVNVSDVSDEVKLEQRLEQERAQNDMQIEMLTTILNVRPQVISEFIRNTKAHVEKINNVLKNPGSSQFELENKLRSIYREMHSLKGEASALKLHSFTKIASQAEDKLQDLQNQGKLSGNDFLPLAVDLDELLNLSNTIEKLGERINQTMPSVAQSQHPLSQHQAPLSEQAEVDETEDAEVDADIDTDADEFIVEHEEEQLEHDISLNEEDELIMFYQDFVQEIAKRQHKDVQLEVGQFNPHDIPADKENAVKNILIQLLRNSVVHGIEDPKVRSNAGKHPTGTIKLASEQAPNGELRLSVEDDGQGINYESIRQRLVALGRYDANEAENLNNGKLLNILFSSGFSTKTDADEDGGRGVGLDIVKELVKENNGKLNVKSKDGVMTKFTLNFTDV